MTVTLKIGQVRFWSVPVQARCAGLLRENVGLRGTESNGDWSHKGSCLV
jgi:hypothetical protein